MVAYQLPPRGAQSLVYGGLCLPDAGAVAIESLSLESSEPVDCVVTRIPCIVCTSLHTQALSAEVPPADRTTIRGIPPRSDADLPLSSLRITTMPATRPNARRYDRRILETLRFFRAMTTHQAAALCGARRSIYDVLATLQREKRIRTYALDESLGAASVQVIQLARDTEDCTETDLQITEALLWSIEQGWRWTVRKPHSGVNMGELGIPVVPAEPGDRTAEDALNRIAELPDAEVVYVDPDREASNWVRREAARRLGKVIHVPPHFRNRKHPNELYI